MNKVLGETFGGGKESHLNGRCSGWVSMASLFPLRVYARDSQVQVLKPLSLLPRSAQLTLLGHFKTQGMFVTYPGARGCAPYPWDRLSLPCRLVPKAQTYACVPCRRHP